jgi:hypothetical protein
MEIKPLSRKRTTIFISLIICGLLACDATFSMGFPTATFTPPTGTATVTPPSLQLNLVALPYNENNLNPPSTITAQVPQLMGSGDPRVMAFNGAISDLLQREVESFKTSLAGLPDPPQVAISTFDTKYNVVYQGGDIWSIKFDMAIYVDGAAHPGDISRTLNYDFANSHIINLADLFLADSNYLEVISKYCASQLATRDIGFDATSLGVEPTPENYRNWNITADGLMITFDRGQVAAYAAPAQVVMIPYDELKSLINPQGPLAVFIK